MTLVLTGSDQATRRAVRTLSHAMEHRTFFVATEGELLAGAGPRWAAPPGAVRVRDSRCRGSLRERRWQGSPRPLFTSDLELFEERGVSGDVWPPLPPSTGWCTIPSSWNSMCPAFVPMRPSSGARKRRCTGKNN